VAVPPLPAASVWWKRRGITRSAGNRRVPVPAVVGALLYCLSVYGQRPEK
jgi:hypothetical protein